MANFGLILKSLRNSRSLTQTELANKLGISYSTISMYERSQRQPDFETLEAIADFFNVDMDYLLGKSDIQNKYAAIVAASQGFSSLDIANTTPPPQLVPKPRLGAIACGTPILAEENHETTDFVPADIKCDFTLECKGDSMIDARILDGDIVYIRSQPSVENGEIAAVLVNSNEATLKRVFFYANKVMLQPANPNYEPLVFVNEEINQIKIIGKAVGFTSKL